MAIIISCIMLIIVDWWDSLNRINDSKGENNDKIKQ